MSPPPSPVPPESVKLPPATEPIPALISSELPAPETTGDMPIVVVPTFENVRSPPMVAFDSVTSVPLDASEFFAYTVEPETVRNRSIDPVSVEFTLSAVPFRLNPWPAVSELPPVWSVPHEKRPVVASHSSLLVPAVSQSVLRPKPRSTEPESAAVPPSMVSAPEMLALPMIVRCAPEIVPCTSRSSVSTNFPSAWSKRKNSPSVPPN